MTNQTSTISCSNRPSDPFLSTTSQNNSSNFFNSWFSVLRQYLRTGTRNLLPLLSPSINICVIIFTAEEKAKKTKMKGSWWVSCRHSDIKWRSAKEKEHETEGEEEGNEGKQTKTKLTINFVIIVPRFEFFQKLFISQFCRCRRSGQKRANRFLRIHRHEKRRAARIEAKGVFSRWQTVRLWSSRNQKNSKSFEPNSFVYSRFVQFLYFTLSFHFSCLLVSFFWHFLVFHRFHFLSSCRFSLLSLALMELFCRLMVLSLLLLSNHFGRFSPMPKNSFSISALWMLCQGMLLCVRLLIWFLFLHHMMKIWAQLSSLIDVSCAFLKGWLSVGESDY